MTTPHQFFWLLVLSCLTSSAYSGNDSNTLQAVAMPVGIYQQQNFVEISARYTGVIEASREANLSFEFAGKVTHLHVDDFAQVEQGQLLAEQDVSVLTERKIGIDAALRQQQAEAELAERSYRRVASLYHDSRVSEQEFDDANYRYQAALDAVSQLQAQQSQLRLEIEKKKLYAPFTGVITKRITNNNEFVASGQTVFQLVDPQDLRARIGLPSQLYQRFEFKQPVKLEADGLVLTGRLIGRDIQQAQHSRTIDLLFQLESAPVYPGQLVRAAVTNRLEQAGYWIPATALTSEDKGRWIIYLLDQQQRIHPEAVKVLHMEHEQAYIQGDLPREIVIIQAGLNKVVPGQQITAVGLRP
ncbi:MAG: efflux RND transporter periplasmic adaptor subunit [Idiomarina sp.]